jgi:AcrR family transcriptional regulator
VAASRSVRTARSGAKSPVSLEQIQNEAVKLFSEKTYPVVGMRDISDAVGLLPGSLYAHIATKEELLLGIVQRGIQNYINTLGPISSTDKPAPERLRLITRKYMETLDASMDQTKVSFQQWTYLGPENREQVVKLREDYEAIFARVINSTTFPSLAHPRIAVLSTMGLLNAAMRWYRPGASLTPGEIGDCLADYALNGLGGQAVN